VQRFLKISSIGKSNYFVCLDYSIIGDLGMLTLKSNPPSNNEPREWFLSESVSEDVVIYTTSTICNFTFSLDLSVCASPEDICWKIPSSIAMCTYIQAFLV
jgi:hypothetical protein